MKDPDLQTSQKSTNPENLVQQCPNCNFYLGVLAGSFDAVCKNCGFKDACCE